jgi:hypothetical protein
MYVLQKTYFLPSTHYFYNNIRRISPNIIMDEEALQKFEKPDTDFLKDKECLICLEPVDLEMNQIVMLPCKCANSAYHIPCITKLLQSGENKNFCPHCKGKYQIAFQQMVSMQNNYLLRIEHANQIYELQMTNYVKILVFHLVSNSTTNITGICVSMSYPEYNNHVELKVLIFFYFLKLFLNYVMLIYSKNNIEKIETILACSYVYKAVVFGFLLYSLGKLTKNGFSTILILNNVLFGVVDLAYRFIMEYKLKNRVVGANV